MGNKKSEKEGQDIRWLQRLSNFKRAFLRLKEAGDRSDLSELEQEGLIQRFEYTYELAWKTLKDFLEYQGYTNIAGSRDTFSQAFQRGIIKDGDAWMEMIKSRQLTSHTYDEEEAEEIVQIIIESYIPMFQSLLKFLEEEKLKVSG
jgi:nucleotidyltransferase substrate binding protein (TIGR01987 family)